MSRALLAGDSMVKYVGQYFPSHQGLAVEVSAHRGAKIKHLLPMIVNKLGSFDVIVHVCTNNTLESVDVYIDKYRRLARDIIASNPRAQVAFSAIFPRGQNEYRMREAQSAKLRRINERYKEVNAALQELARSRASISWMAWLKIGPAALPGMVCSRAATETSCWPTTTTGRPASWLPVWRGAESSATTKTGSHLPGVAGQNHLQHPFSPVHTFLLLELTVLLLQLTSHTG